MSEENSVTDNQTLLFRARLQLEEGTTEDALKVLQKLIPENEQQQQEVRYLTGWAYIQLREWEKAIEMLAPILLKAEEELKNEQAQLTDREQLAHYLLQLGIAAINLEHYQDASLHLNLCLKVLHDRRVHLPRVRIQVRYSLATTCLMRGLLEPAQQNYEEALRLCEYYDRSDEIPNIYYGLADTHRRAKDFVTAYNLAQKALELYRAQGDRPLEARVQNLLGRISQLLGSYQEAAKHYTESITLANLNNQPLLAMINCVALADLYILEEDLEAARRYSGMAREYMQRSERQVLLIAPYHISGKVAYKEAQQAEGEQRYKLLTEAVMWYEKAAKYAKTTQAYAEKAELFGNYAHALEDLGLHKQALEYWRGGYESLRGSNDSSQS